MRDLVELAKPLTKSKIAVYPNRGGSWNAKLGIWQEDADQSLANYWTSWSDLGLAYVGGCCGTDSTSIAELAHRVKG